MPAPLTHKSFSEAPMHELETVLDLEIFNELVENVGIDFVPTIIDEFAKEVRSRERQLTEASSAGDVNSIRIIGHSLRGSSSTMGAKIIRDKAHQIERFCNNSGGVQLHKMIKDLRFEIDRFLFLFNEILDRAHAKAIPSQVRAR